MWWSICESGPACFCYRLLLQVFLHQLTSSLDCKELVVVLLPPILELLLVLCIVITREVREESEVSE